MPKRSRESSYDSDYPKRRRMSSSSSSSDDDDMEEAPTPKTYLSNDDIINKIEYNINAKFKKQDKDFIRYCLSMNKSLLVSEVKYFIQLSLKDKINILNTFKQVQNINNSNVPYLFKALQSNMNINTKAEFINKINTQLNTSWGGEDAKFKLWMQSLLKIPFGVYSNFSLQRDYIKEASKILDQSVYGHKQAKQKILQILAQRISQPKSEGLILGIKGTKGTGKTVLTEQGIAKALGKPFFHISLGGLHDGGYLDGFCYTFEGSTYGRIADILMKAKVMDPVIYFDELDKVSNTERGNEIINILIHLTDPSQNKSFQDKYFSGVDLDLSRATLIFSYNDSSHINPILLDRITEVHVDGFKLEEKLKIARKFLIPSIVKEVGWGGREIKVSDKILTYMIENYTYEGGVRKLKEKLFEIYRELNFRIIRGDSIHIPIHITEDLLKTDLLYYYRPYTAESIYAEDKIGFINGMYASDSGGGITPIEIREIPTKEKLMLELTGLQGNVMKESMKVARTVAWERIPDSIKYELQTQWKQYGNSGYHIHVPEGATPKDGPSAGLAITACLISYITKQKIRKDIAVTGEIDLNGNALEIGGLNKKLYGAKKAGIKIALYPEDNHKDIEKIKKDYPKLIKEGEFEVYPVKNIYNVLQYVLTT